MSENTALVILFASLLAFIAVLLWLLVQVITSPVGMAILALGALAIVAAVALGAFKRTRKP
jgi:hypothetical protein